MKERDTLKIGDKMRFSVELLKDIDQMPNRQTAIVEIVRIEEYDDGIVLCWLNHAELSQ